MIVSHPDRAAWLAWRADPDAHRIGASEVAALFELSPYRAPIDVWLEKLGRAAAVNDRIANVERVGEALFKEWKGELSQYSSDSLRRASEQQMNDTRVQYDKLIGVMKAAAGKMKPVLTAFKDQVLFLKHNLNARAIASLQANADQLQGDIAALVRDMETSIAEANSFIQQMQSAK